MLLVYWAALGSYGQVRGFKILVGSKLCGGTSPPRRLFVLAKLMYHEEEEIRAKHGIRQRAVRGQQHGFVVHAMGTGPAPRASL
jgi:hypothetical protein